MKFYTIHFHDTIGVNRCFGNSREFKTRAHNVLLAIKKFYKQPGNECPIYFIVCNKHEEDERTLSYTATQELLRMEGYAA